jgi:hypothetical protein
MDVISLLGAAKTSLDLLKLGLDVRDDQKVREAMTDLNEKLFSLSMASFSAAQSLNELQAAVAALEANNRELEAKLKERSAYVLHEVKPGSFCYRFQPEEGAVEPVHYLCQVCYDKGVKSVLRLVDSNQWHSQHYFCVAGGNAHSICL